MKSVLKFVGKNFMKDQRFEVNNRRKIILVIGITGVGKSSFINFITNKTECEVSDGSKSCTKDYKLVELYDKNTMYYFVDTPGLDDSDGDKENIEEIINFRNTVPRINTIIYCQELDVQRVTHSAIDLFKLMKQLYPDPSLFSHFIIVRTKSDRTSAYFEKNKQKCQNSIYSELQRFKLIGNEKGIPEYYIDSEGRDNESLCEKNRIIDRLEKMDPLFMRIDVKIIDHVEYYDAQKNRMVIKTKKYFQYEDYDGTVRTNEDKETEVIDLNGIKDVEVVREDSGDYKGCCCCKYYKIIYRIFHINEKNEQIEAEKPVEYWQSVQDEDKSKTIKKEKKRELGFI
jgi:GTP-binding protein EngB required for normal cell division